MCSPFFSRLVMNASLSTIFIHGARRIQLYRPIEEVCRGNVRSGLSKSEMKLRGPLCTWLYVYILLAGGFTWDTMPTQVKRTGNSPENIGSGTGKDVRIYTELAHCENVNFIWTWTIVRPEREEDQHRVVITVEESSNKLVHSHENIRVTESCSTCCMRHR